MKQFNKEQLKAIRHGDGPMMVLAGPGSGKVKTESANGFKVIFPEGIPFMEKSISRY